MGLLEIALAPLRAVVRGAVRDAERSGAGRELEGEEQRMHERAEAFHRTADSLEKHALVLDQLSAEIPALAESVNHLTAQLASLERLLGPLDAAERDVSRLEHLFGRRRQDAPGREG